MTQVRSALAALLGLPEECVDIAGVHRGSIIIDLNLTTPPGDSRTPTQVYQNLAPLTAAAEERGRRSCSLLLYIEAALYRSCFTDLSRSANSGGRGARLCKMFYCFK